jgi:EAL domain-containing protein (putative c-di-GMP-specific phosphodiesterase class I)
VSLVRSATLLRSSSLLPIKPVMRDVGQRTRIFVVSSAAALLLAVAICTAVLTSSAGDFASRHADLRARLGVDLLVIVGPEMPDLSPARVAAGLAPGDDAELDRAVAHGQADGVLSSLMIWDRSGRIVYSSEARPPRTGALDPDIAAALHGGDVIRRHPSEMDFASHARTGVLDAFEPLRDGRGRVYGAVEIGLPLRPIAADAARVRARLVLFLLGGATLLWLVLLPFTIRAARAAAHQWIPGRRRTLRAFRRALTRGEIELAYQPQIDPGTGVVHGVEALVRWRRDGRVEPPDSFLPIVEDSSLMAPMTDRIVDLALAQLAAWNRAGHTVRMSVNLSARDLADETLPARIAAALARHEVVGAKVTTEVTETAILEDPARARRILDEITALGVEIAVDDFGTGHASISRLHQLPVTEVKVDRSFVSNPDQRSRAYLEAIAGFGRKLGLRVVAEGVEDAETLAFLVACGCDLAQGYHISRPLDSEQMNDWLARAPLNQTPADTPARAA